MRTLLHMGSLSCLRLKEHLYICALIGKLLLRCSALSQDYVWYDIITERIKQHLLCIPGAIAASGGFIENMKPVYLQGVSCTGSEASLFNCTFATTENSACTQRSDASVICQGI